jgi:glycyl-tRNA synthetase (class II)
MDEIGMLYSITLDGETAKDQALTIRDLRHRPTATRGTQ